MGLVREANRYFDASAPWQLQKEGKEERLRTTLYVSLEAIRVAAALLSPVLPTKSLDIRRAVGVAADRLESTGGELEHLRALQPGAPVGIGDPVFPRIDKKGKPVNIQSPPSDADGQTETEGLIDIDDFGKVQLVVAEVIEAERVEGADRLLRLKVKVGSEERPLVAGIAEHYEPEALIGRRVIIVKNLKPATIRGVESRGMLLAAKKGKKLTLVTTDGEIPSGASVG
jgi:methionyl-tRNA synthetase